MKYFLYIIFLFILISNCTIVKVTNHHGVKFLENKQKKLEIKKSNKNDIVELLGPPSTKSTFDNDMWIYIEKVTSSSGVLKLGKKDLIENNILIVEIDNKGMLAEKLFLDMNKMNKLNFFFFFTSMSYTQRSFVYSFLTSMRKKINDPLGMKNK